MATQLGLRNVTFLGAVLHERLPSIYEGHDIMPNGSLRDNFPGSLLEAFICGLPVVSTNSGGIL